MRGYGKLFGKWCRGMALAMAWTMLLVSFPQGGFTAYAAESGAVLAEEPAGSEPSLTAESADSGMSLTEEPAGSEPSPTAEPAGGDVSPAEDTAEGGQPLPQEGGETTDGWGEKAIFATGASDGLSYTTESVYATVSGYTGSPVNLVIPETVVLEGTTYTVSKIGAKAFNGCTSLQSVVLPGTLTEIEKQGFYGCKNLKSINIPKNLTTVNNLVAFPVFGACSSLTEVTFEEGITKIPDNLFAGCTGLKQIVIPATVTNIGEWAFYKCTGLTSVDMSASKISAIESKAFSYCAKLETVKLPDSLTSIGNNCFEECTSLKTMAFPANMTHMGYAAFSGCTSLKSINVPKNLVTVGNTELLSVFGMCSSLTDVTFDAGIKKIPDNIFCGCTGLARVVIPETVTSIGEYAFYACSNLTSVDMSGAKVSEIGNYAFQKCKKLSEVKLSESLTKMGNDCFASCIALRGITLPAKLENIGYSAFYACSSLQSINIPKNAKAPTGYSERLAVFGACDSLREVTFNSGITRIPDNLFCYCPGLVEVIIPSTVKTIGENAFLGCSGLVSVYIPASVTEIQADAFKNCRSFTTIKGEPGSYAEKYAKENNYTFEDGRVNAIAAAIVDADGNAVTQRTLRKGETLTLKAKLTPPAGAGAVTESVTWKSSDKKVVTVADGVVKAVGIGTATITLQAKNCSAEAAFTVSDSGEDEPILESSSVILYQAMEGGVEIGLIAVGGNAIKNVSITSELSVPDGLKIVRDGDRWHIATRTPDTYSKNTTEKVTLLVSTGKGDFTKQMTVVINVTKPSLKLKKVSAANLFYTDAEAVYTAVSNYEITGIKTDSQVANPGFVLKDYDVKTGRLTLGVTKDYSASNNKAGLLVSYKNYSGAFPVSVAVTTVSKAPSYKLEAVTVAQGVGVGYARVKCGREIADLSDITVTKEGTDDVLMQRLPDNRIRLSYTGSGKSVAYSLILKGSNWSRTISLKGKISVVAPKSLAITPGSSKVTLNKSTAIDGVAVPVSIKGNCDISQIAVSLEYDTSKLYAEYSEGVLTIRGLTASTSGKYKIKLSGTLGDAAVKAGAVTVTVTDKAASVSLKKKGSINLTARSTTSMVYTPKPVNFNAVLVGAKLTGADAEKFTATLAGGNVIVKAGTDQTLKSGVVYKPVLELTYASNAAVSQRTVVEKELSFKMSNTLPAVKSNAARGTLYLSNSGWKINARLTKSAAYEISRVELLEDKKTKGKFSVTWNPETETAVIDLTETARADSGFKRGNYTVKYKVYFKDSDPSKYKTLNVKVTVK